MNDHPESEEQLAEQHAPNMMPAAYGARDSSNQSDQVYDQEGRWRDEQARPFEHVQLGKVGLFVGFFGRSMETDIYSGEDFEQALENSKQVRRDTSYYPELFSPPPLINPDPAPSHFQYVGGEDR